MGGTDAGRLSVANTLGGTGGEEKHLLIVSEMPSHTHLQNAHNHSQTNHTHGNTLTDNGHTHGYIVNIQHGDGTVVAGEALTSGLTLGGRRRYLDTTGNNNQTPMTINNAGATANVQDQTATNQNAGGDTAHNVMQPYILTNYIIKT
jgi:microcystin-dependent protein